MKIGIQKTVDVEAKTLSICCKVRDEFTAHILDQDGEIIGGQDGGYVPDFMPGDHYGDYLMLDIDLETGKITNWITPDDKDIEDFINKFED